MELKKEYEELEKSLKKIGVAFDKGSLVRDGLFLSPSRTYGETFIEPLIRRKYGLKKPKKSKGSYDAVDSNGYKYEIKASKVMTKNITAKYDQLILKIIYEKDNLETDRMFSFDMSHDYDYLANIQNVKRDHFDFLIYVLLFADCMKVFKVDKKSIEKGEFSRWCDFHGRYDKPGKSGQFGITKDNIKWHLEKYLIDTITYDEAAKIYEDLKDNDC